MPKHKAASRLFKYPNWPTAHDQQDCENHPGRVVKVKGMATQMGRGRLSKKDPIIIYENISWKSQFSDAHVIKYIYLPIINPFKNPYLHLGIPESYVHASNLFGFWEQGMTHYIFETLENPDSLNTEDFQVPLTSKMDLPKEGSSGDECFHVKHSRNSSTPGQRQTLRPLCFSTW